MTVGKETTLESKLGTDKEPCQPACPLVYQMSHHACHCTVPIVVLLCRVFAAGALAVTSSVTQ